VKINIQRSIDSKSTSRKGWKAMKAKKVIALYSTPEKGQKVVDQIIQSGQWYEDVNCPGDREEYWLWIQSGDEFTKDVVVNEHMSGSMDCAIDDASKQELFGEGGLLEAV
jgi:hypothetical protein